MKLPPCFDARPHAPYLDPNTNSNDGPKLEQRAQKAIVSDTLELQVDQYTTSILIPRIAKLTTITIQL